MRALSIAVILGLLSVACSEEPAEEYVGQSTDPGADLAALTIDEWHVPWENTRPRDPFVAPDGRVWFCGQAGGYLGVFDPETEEMDRYDLGDGAGPHNLIVDDDGMVWYAGNRRAHIGKLDPETGEITKFNMPRDDARDPHTMVWTDDGNIWFTLQGSNMVGHLNTQSGDVELIDVPTSGARPYGIKLDSNGTPWVALFGTNKLARVNPEEMSLTEIELPNEDSHPRRLVVTSDDMIYYGDYALGYLGRYNPEANEFTEWEMPSGEDARPYAMAVDDEDRVWFVETGVDPNIFAGFDTSDESFFTSAAVPSGGGTLRHMYFHAPGNEIWFGTDTNYVGRALLP